MSILIDLCSSDDEKDNLPLKIINNNSDNKDNNNNKDNNSKDNSNNNNIKQTKKRKVKNIFNEEAKLNKINKKIEEQQKHGYYKHKELSLHIEESIYNSPLGSEIGSHVYFSSENKSFGYYSMRNSIPGLCIWTYRSYLDGGHGGLGEVGVVALPLAFIIFPVQKFIHLALQSNDGFTFNEFSDELKSIRNHLIQSQSQSQNGNQNQPIKIIIALIGIYEECIVYQRTHRSELQNIPSLSQRIDEVIAYLIYMEDVEVCCRKNSSELSIYLESVTRTLGDQLYQEEKSSLDSFKKLPKRPLTTVFNPTPQQVEEYEYHQTWINMLQMIPGVSKAKAELLVSHYPSPSHLIEVLNNSSLSVETRMLLLQDKFGKLKAKKLSKLIYSIFTATDPTTSLQID